MWRKLSESSNEYCTYKEGGHRTRRNCQRIQGIRWIFVQQIWEKSYESALVEDGMCTICRFGVAHC